MDDVGCKIVSQLMTIGRTTSELLRKDIGYTSIDIDQGITQYHRRDIRCGARGS